MKVTDWRRKLAASLVAGGLMYSRVPCMGQISIRTWFLIRVLKMSAASLAVTRPQNLTVGKMAPSMGSHTRMAKGTTTEDHYLVEIPRPVPDSII